MAEHQSTADLRILAEMAEEIDSRGMAALPGALRSCVRTTCGQAVAATLERVSMCLLTERHRHGEERARLQREIDGLRSTIEQLTDAALASDLTRTPPAR